MRRALFSSLLLAASALTAPTAHASVVLLANGVLSGTTDLSGLTGTLENGLPGNILGGLGSGLAYAGGNTFLALPDRGPNATPYNSAVDDTVSYISRFQTVSMSLTPSSAGSKLPFTLTPTLTGTTLLSSASPLIYGSGTAYGLPSGAPSQNTAGKNYFTGRSDNFGSGTSGNPADARFDPESIRVSNDGKSVFISDEYGPYVRQFDRATGTLIKTYTLPSNLDVANLSPQGAVEISGNTSGRVANKGMEGLALTPDGKTLVGILQASTIQDVANGNSTLLRIVTIDVASGQTHEFGYTLTTGSGVSEIVAVNDHQFLVDERDGKGLGDGSKAKVKQIFEIDTTGADDLVNVEDKDVAAKTPVTKSAKPFLDLVAALNADGISSSQIPSKIEGLAFGEDVTINGIVNHTLYIANDNDFVPAASGPSQYYVFGFQDGDLPGYMAQELSSVPLPPGMPLFAGALGVLGLLGWRRQHTRNA